MNKIFLFTIFIFFQLLISCKQEKDINIEPQDKSGNIPVNINQDTFSIKRINSNNLIRNAELIISKTRRTLSVYESSDLKGFYKIALGINPVSDKIKHGDFATPEGEFFVCFKNSHSKFHLSLLISYPNIEDAERGLKDSMITMNEYKNICNAIKQKRTPPQNTALGGDICIHGGGTNSDWTFGCIALDNQDIEEIFNVIPVGTKVKIEK